MRAGIMMLTLHRGPLRAANPWPGFASAVARASLVVAMHPAGSELPRRLGAQDRTCPRTSSR
ncbi:hypothetical protein [Lysobacter gummosus]|uniref:hypothetical protein n=1 Tax=Lysobacter gummosus TaxID=262324 RepID=UPI00362C16FD